MVVARARALPLCCYCSTTQLLRSPSSASSRETGAEGRGYEEGAIVRPAHSPPSARCRDDSTRETHAAILQIVKVVVG